MAKQKHVAPLEDSDHEEEEEDSSEGEDEVASSNEDEDTDEGEDERDKHVLVPRKPQPQTVSKPSSSSSEVELDSEPEPDPEPESLLENAKASSKLKSQPSSAVSEAKSGSKRAAKNSIDHSNQPKRGKKAQDDDVAGSDEEDPNKSRDEFKYIFEKVFSEKDEKAGKSTPKKALVPHSNEGLALTKMLRYDGTFGEPYGEGYIRKGIELLGVSKREEIEARWRKFEDAEKKLHAEIAEFYAEQAQLIYQKLHQPGEDDDESGVDSN
ncbi:uncharacterized protein LOC107468190 isoform X1 [Arachis duranensis]|uniref:Uncharacterized protein LOC107468190 isoform X1 n=1 Tax=Arachis duranensis TaxID=130453 RepID=A0A6P4C8A8_ARADU|nr:uncharacterized protein LOC107468190 isoform X1 [Arachis duranensis]